MDSSKDDKQKSELAATESEGISSEFNTEAEDKQIFEIQETNQEKEIEEKESKNKNLLLTSSEGKENGSESGQNKQNLSGTNKEKNERDKSRKEGIGTSQSVDQSNIHYEGDVCVYTDPETKNQYLWDDSKQEWIERNSANSDYTFDGQTYTYTDNNKVTYQWDKETNSWKKKNDNDGDAGDGKSEVTEDVEDKKSVDQSLYGYEGDTYTYTDATDGTAYFWDKGKNAWFPKVDEDFLAQYQMSYGFVDNNDNKEKEAIHETKQEKLQNTEVGIKRKAPEPPAWFDVGEESTKVYVSKLPLDITETEFVDVMQKCGLVMKDMDTGKMKVKLYAEPGTNQLKGDALCTYIKKESVDLALNLLDGYDLRGHRIRVERAKFTMKGDAYDPSLKPKKKRRKDKEKLKKMQERLFDWRPEKLRGEKSKHEKVVIVKNLFDPSIFDKEVGLILEYQQDLRDECLKCGGVRKIIIYDRHPEGIAQITFKEFEAADACVQLLNNRWFCQRQITAEIWDGKTKYKIVETEEEIKKRLEKWGNYLVSDEKKRTDEGDNKDVSSVAKDSGVVEESKKVDDSDQETRSSAGSDDETDEETTSGHENNSGMVDK